MPRGRPRKSAAATSPAAPSAPRSRANNQPQVPFARKLILNQWLLSLFNVKRFDDLAEHLRNIFGRPGLVLHGSTAVKERQKLVEAFQRDEGPPFFVLSLKAGGTGLNLTAASHVIHFDRWWNPAVENQATDRAFRIGQKKNVLVHKFVCRGTVEERIDELIAGKQKLSDEILTQGGESALTEMSNAELISMVSLDLNRALAE